MRNVFMSQYLGLKIFLHYFRSGLLTRIQICLGFLLRLVGAVWYFYVHSKDGNAVFAMETLNAQHADQASWAFSF